jgi:hypothetical protein
MSSRLLLSGTLAAPIARRVRRADGKAFAVTTVRDTDRGEPRSWTVFVNDPSVIEKIESMKDGEPIALCGAFSIAVNGSRLTYKISAEAVIGARKSRKKKSATPDDDLDDAPRDDGGLNDPLPQWGA